VRAALLAGKSVVTANKQLIAHYGAELGDLARVRGQQLRFEASVAGGIPVLRALQEGLAGDRLVEVRGILNGTCAYILSRMQSAELPFAEALAEAQAAGFAEADPTEDVDGADAAAKLAIIAAVGLRRAVRVGDITRQSIRPIDIVDFQYAREIGCTIRQIARAAVQDDGHVFAVVSPALVPLNSSFGRIDGSQNVVMVRGVYGGETSFSGSGAGGSPTAVAVVSDLLSIRRQTTSGETVDTAFIESAAATAVHEVSNDFVAPHYVRFTVADRPGILADIFAVFARHEINVEAVVQLPRYRKDRLPFVATIEACASSILNRALTDIAAADFHVEPPLAMPILR
jgi:homoserine dehydrogenase